MQMLIDHNKIYRRIISLSSVNNLLQQKLVNELMNLMQIMFLLRRNIFH